jgi:hypothetical protein
MSKNTRSDISCHDLRGLPLFDWHVEIFRPTTPGGRYLMRRSGVRPELADLMARFAGIGPGDSK